MRRIDQHIFARKPQRHCPSPGNLHRLSFRLNKGGFQALSLGAITGRTRYPVGIGGIGRIGGISRVSAAILAIRSEIGSKACHSRAKPALQMQGSERSASPSLLMRSNPPPASSRYGALAEIRIAHRRINRLHPDRWIRWSRSSRGGRQQFQAGRYSLACGGAHGEPDTTGITDEQPSSDCRNGRFPFWPSEHSGVGENRRKALSRGARVSVASGQ